MGSNRLSKDEKQRKQSEYAYQLQNDQMSQSHHQHSQPMQSQKVDLLFSIFLYFHFNSLFPLLSLRMFVI
jgi:hypothetical protein